MGTLRPMLADAGQRQALMAEWAWVLGQGPGVLVLKRAYPDTGVIDRATAVYEAIIAREKAAGAGGADHFAAAGANDRIWNSLQKLCLEDPETFALYFGNPVIDAVCEAWLGPFHQMTAQVNLVRPGEWRKVLTAIFNLASRRQRSRRGSRPMSTRCRR
jgi:ectoine hydroxylase-related dioxygenase (phytanoyl-CoA dioxygenase family)